MAATAKSIPFVVSSQSGSKKSKTATKPPLIEDSEGDLLLKQLTDVLSFDRTAETGNLQALHSIAFLMEWASNAGNDPLDAMAANGLSHLLRQLAGDVQQHVGFIRLTSKTRTAEGERCPYQLVYSIEDAAKRLGISEPTVRQYVEQGTLPVLRLGKHRRLIRIHRQALENLASSMRSEKSSEAHDWEGCKVVFAPTRRPYPSFLMWHRDRVADSVAA